VSVLVEGGRSGGGVEPSHTVPVAVQDEEVLNSFLHSNLQEGLSHAVIASVVVLQTDTSHAVSAIENQKVTKNISVARVQLNNNYIVQTLRENSKPTHS